MISLPLGINDRLLQTRVIMSFFFWITSYISNQSYDGNQLSLSGLPLGPAYYDVSIFPKAPFIKEELEENHARARHLSHTTHAVEKLPKTTDL